MGVLYILGMKLYPLKFKAIFKERIWGGDGLNRLFNKALPANTKIGESWELADLPDDKSVIANGWLAGLNIAQVLDKYPVELAGSAEFKRPFPLLIKLLDAQDILSVQVHPDKAACERMGTGEPKTECWYIIRADKDAYIYKDVKRGTTREQFAAAIKNGTVADLLVKVFVKAGECHFLPSGTVHAIGAGLMIAEIQQPSDTTYRVFDFNRVDDSGKPRKLHVEEALESTNFNMPSDKLTVRHIGRLVESEFFCIDKGHQAGRCETLMDGGLKVLMFLSGSGKIVPADRDIEVVHFEKGETVLVPASYKGAVRFDEDCEHLIITLPR